MDTNKALLEADALLNGYFMVYKKCWDKNDSHMQKDLICSIAR